MNNKQLLSYTSRDYAEIFSELAKIAESIDSRVAISEDRGNPETIITKLLSAASDMLSYNLDRTVLECFPSTVTQRHSAMDIFSVIGYIMHRYKSSRVNLEIYNRTIAQDLIIYPYEVFSTSNGISYCNLGIIDVPGNQAATSIPVRAEVVQGSPVKPTEFENWSFPLNHWTDRYDYNLSVNNIVDSKLKMEDLDFDPSTIYIRDENKQEWTYIKNPFMVNTTSSQFSVLEDPTGVYLVFSKNIYSGFSNNLKMFYLTSSGKNGQILENRLGFSGTAYGTAPPYKAFAADLTIAHEKSTEGLDIETPSMAREGSAIEFGFRQSTNSLITGYDFERAVAQLPFVAAVKAVDQNSFSRGLEDKFSGHVFVMLNEDEESKLSEYTAVSFISQIHSHIVRGFKLLPLELDIHIEDQPITTNPEEVLTKVYTWYPDITIYTRRTIYRQEGVEILHEVNKALLKRYQNMNIDFNEVPLIRDIIETVQNAHELIEYLDVDGFRIMTSSKDPEHVPERATKRDVICKFQEAYDIHPGGSLSYDLTLDTEDSLGEHRNIQYHSVKVTTENNTLIAKDNGDGLIISDTDYLIEPGTIDYETGEVEFTLNGYPRGSQIFVEYKHETPTFCRFVGITDKVKIGKECYRKM